ncbi:aminotransferase class III-fold pyridoxal phosphate-dependent enzyme [Candidatus Uhrbacteria bacterium]|nr:aminotransferase class III-fold pyridoxal phosphate-dependent enzyme [Candidatus Uhrbacteria bacterium]
MKLMNLTKSLAMQEASKRRIPGMNQLLSKRPDMFSLGVWPGYYQRAKGVEVWDLDGNRYIDMSIGGIGANVLGYADPDVNAAVTAAIDNGSSSSLNCPEEVELADLLCEIHPWAEKVRFARGGGEGMAIAVRIARAFTGRDIVAVCGYHGWNDWYLAVNLERPDGLNDLLLPGLEPRGVPRGLRGTVVPFPYNRLDILKTIIKEHGKDLAAIVIEPIRGSDPTPEFLPGVRALADEAGAVLVVDEVSAAFRLNSGGAHLLYGLTPDIAVFSKAMGNGYPIAAVIGKGQFMDAAELTFMSSTMWSERVGPTAALATIQKHRTLNVGKHLVKIGKQVQEGWKQIAQRHALTINVGGIYPASHFNFEHEHPLAIKALYVQLMLEQGFLASNLCYAMYAHTSDHVVKYLEATDRAFGEIAVAIRAGDVEKRLNGKPANAGFRRLA